MPAPKKERAGMKRNPSESGIRNLADELAALRGLDATTLRQRWRVLYRTEAPVRIGQALLLQAVAYRLQERVLGGLKSSTRRLLERAAEDKVDRRPPTEAPATRVTPGTVLIREWHGTSHHVTVLADGVLLRGALSLTLGGGAQDYRDPLVWAAVLRAERADQAERSWNTLSPCSGGVPSTPASRPRRD
jgi:hypothetical protein